MTLLACIDASIYRQSVLDHAAWAARRLGLGVDLLHVINKPPELTPTVEPDGDGDIAVLARDVVRRNLAQLDAQRSQLAVEHGRLLLGEASAALGGDGIEPVRSLLRHGHLVEAVEEFAPQAGLIVLGKRGERADFAKLHLGRNLERVVRACATPLLVASRAFSPVREAVIAFDGGPSSRKAVELASGGKLLEGVRTHVVCAGSDSSELQAHLRWASALLEAREIDHVIEHVDGHPEQVIAGYVQRHPIDLLMMGAYGHTRVRDFIVGSTTTAMIRTCLIPVLLVR